MGRFGLNMNFLGILQILAIIFTLKSFLKWIYLSLVCAQQYTENLGLMYKIS
jgi:hypothetical protein